MQVVRLRIANHRTNRIGGARKSIKDPLPRVTELLERVTAAFTESRVDVKRYVEKLYLGYD